MNILYLYTISRPQELENITRRLLAILPADSNVICSQYFDLVCKLLLTSLTATPPIELGWAELA